MKFLGACLAALAALVLFSFGGSRSWSQEAAATPTAPAAAGQLPAWAYVDPVSGRGRGPATQQGTVDPQALEHVPGSTQAFTHASANNLFNTPDWFPESHPPMPDVVAHGRQPNVWSCGFCHLPNGLARPENESVAGLPAAYIVQQVHDFKNGLRQSSDPKLTSVQHMTNVAKAVSDEDLNAAAQYYSSIKPTASMHVVETETVPTTQTVGFMLQEVDGPKEPIGDRIIELPQDRDRTELHDPSSGFLVYVPKGSLEKGKELVSTGRGITIPCTTCHGANLRGVGNVPSIAGRSPTQMARQIIDFQTGARHGQGAQMMKPVVANLSVDDVLSIVGYLASQNP